MKTKINIISYNPKLKKYARELRKNMTLAEIMLWKQLQKEQMLGFDFDRQRPIDEFIVDFYCKVLQLAIEIDGSSHDNPKRHAKDKLRQERLEKFGISFLRFTEYEVRSNLEGVIFKIRKWIEKRI